MQFEISGWVMLVPILLPIIGGLMLAFCQKLKAKKCMEILVTGLLALSTVFVVLICLNNRDAITLWVLTDKLSFALQADGVARLFAVLASVGWTLVAIYAQVYMQHEVRTARFYSFYLIVYGMLMGLFFSGNLITMYLFFEMVTLTSMPLVMHTRTKESVAAAQKYLYYSVGGAFLALFGIFFIYHYGDAVKLAYFTPGSAMNLEALEGNMGLLLAAVFMMIVGFGAKAGMFPLHGWLPTAHPVAPAPASAVLSGIITKAGVFTILRTVYYAVGPELLRGTWVQTAWIILAVLTVFMGSMLALKEKVFKKRLAYSTVSQVSYILLGLAFMNTTAMEGALLHVVFHSLSKNALFMTAGAVIYKTGLHNVDELRGIGKRMPVVMWSFTLASLTLIGIPPTGAFLSKWYLATGAMAGEMSVLSWLAPVVLLVSALLTAGYLMPVAINGFMPGNDFDYDKLEKCEPAPSMTVPVLIFAAAAVLLGVFAAPLISYVAGVAGTLL
ncbi:MAG: proton-conducting membrane transporter [Ruminococcaceae bacterium]|nr:proton-conducting membrane transporter [Oscillospiraceae bacterium]